MLSQEIFKIEMAQEDHISEAWLSLGEQLIKECQLSQYVLESGSTNSVSTWNRILDFLNRILNRFIAWIRKGHLKEAKKILMKMKQSDRYSNRNREILDETMNTKFWNMSWYTNNVTNVMVTFRNTRAMQMLMRGDVKTTYDRNTSAILSEVEQSKKNLNEAYKAMISDDHKPESTVMEHDMIDEIIRNVIDFGINTVYEDLRKSREAISIIKKTELKDNQFDDSKNVAQQWTHILTILGQCITEELRILQKTADVLVHGALSQANPITREGDRSVVEKNYTLGKLKKTLREDIFNNYSNADTHGVRITLNDVHNENGKCYIKLIWMNNSGTNETKIISCDDINLDIRNFVNAHNPVHLADVR